MIATSALLGKGLYSPAEAAIYARMRTQTLNRWLFGNNQGEPALVAQFPADKSDKVVTFLDFVQLLAVREIRQKHKVPLKKIRQAVELAKAEGIPYPFAVHHKTFLFGDMAEEGHGEVVLEIGGKLIQASGKHRRQPVMPEVAELYMEDLYFDPGADLASRYFPFGSALNRSVVMNPRVQFGEPMVVSCGYTAEALFEAYRIEGGVEPAAKAFGVERSDVEASLKYFDLLSI